MVPDRLYFVVPGDIETRTGGYGYDREILAGLRARGWQVALVSLTGTYPSPTELDRATAAAALAALPDGALVLVDGLAFGALPAEVGYERTRLRLIALVHHPLGLETGISEDDSKRLLASEEKALTAAVGVVVTSPRTVGAVQDLGFPGDRIVVVEPGTESAEPAKGSGGGPLHLLCVASVVPRKGYDTLLDALASLMHLDWTLTIVGSLDREAAYASEIAARCGAAPFNQRVTLAGELAGAALESQYVAADLFVLPTHYEGYGMVIAEAVARAIPVVSTKTGAIESLVGDSAGVLVPPGDAASLSHALETLLTDRARLGQLRQGALARRGTLQTWAAAAASMEQALRRFAGA